MRSLFWTNTIWYILLAITSVAALIVALKRSSDRRFTAAFWLGVLGFTYILEVILVIVFNAYNYRPGLVLDSFQDSVLGNIFSQISVSASALLIAVFGLSWIWRAGFSVTYFLVDALFSALGIYEHIWYRSIYSLFGFFVYSWFIQFWYGKLQAAGHGHRRLSVLAWFLGVFAVTGNTIILPQKLLKLQIFQIGLFADMSKDHTTGMLIYGPILIILILAYQFWSAPRVFKWIPFVFITAMQFLLYSGGFISIKPGWILFVTAADLLGIYAWSVWIGRSLNLLRPKEHSFSLL